MPSPRHIDIDLMNKLFSYSETTGELKWKERSIDMCSSEHAMKSFNNKKAGTVAGGERTNKNGKTYLVVKVDNYTHLVHRICYAINTGEQPKFIDHINGCGTDNRWENIRSTTITENNRNMRMFKTNTSGVCGVGKFRNRWQAHIWIRCNQVNLGVFDTKGEAVAARQAAEKVLGYHENHGEDRRNERL